MTRVLVSICLSLFCGSFAAFASPASDATVKETKNIVKQLKNGKFAESTQKALNALVRRGVQELNEQGFENEAAQYSTQWETQFAKILLSNRDLGDHEPMSQWLTNFYNDLERILGKKICHLLSLDDIFIFNYSIPVVFHPNGYNYDTWDKAEYQKHFVPFAGAVTYWAAQIACTALGAGIDGIICSVAAIIPRKVVEKWVAPHVSNYVYNKATGDREIKLPRFNIDELVLNYAD